MQSSPVSKETLRRVQICVTEINENMDGHDQQQ